MEGKIEYDGLKRKHNTYAAILRFHTMERLQKAKILVETITVKGKQLRGSIPRDDRPNGGDQRSGKRQKTWNGNDQKGGGDGAPSATAPQKTLNEAVTPLLHLPYEEQLRRKQQDMVNLCIGKMYREVKEMFFKRNRQQKQNQKPKFVLPPWLVAGPQEFKMEDIRPSPVTSAYRYVMRGVVRREAENCCP